MLMFNQGLSDELGLGLDTSNTDQLARVFSGAEQLPGSQPLAMAYAGHQFGQFVPQLGDGRALLLGEVINGAGRRLDIQLKGSGRTPFSRGGDGMAAIGPVLREYLISEAMEKLGVPTTRALAAVAIGEPILRDRGPEPGAVLTRVGSSHIRVGTFQYFAARGDNDALKTLTRYVIDRHDPDLAEAANPALELLKAVADRQAYLISRWIQVGFIHGVMNTDNCSISGETIDYGPCAFMDAYHPATVFSSIDHQGRYAFSNQPGIGHWNLARLAETLLPLLDSDEDKSLALANEVISSFPEVFQAHWRRAMGAKVGLTQVSKADDELIGDLLNLMQEQRLDYTHTFRTLAQRINPDTDQPPATGQDPQAWTSWLSHWRQRLNQESASGADAIARGMNAANPAVIPRNHQVEAALTAARENADMGPFQKLHEALQNPFDDRDANRWLQALPPADLPPYRTFCGT